jgi:RNA polymerase sigma-70 factor (family 1)
MLKKPDIICILIHFPTGTPLNTTIAMPDTSIPELKTLVYEIAHHDSQPAYKKMFILLFNSLFRLSFSLLYSRQLAEEVASDVMLKLWQRRRKLLQIENIRVYALVMAKNQSLNELKKTATGKVIFVNHHRHLEEEVDVTDPEQILIAAQNKATLNRSIDSLPRRCKMVFKLVKEEGLNYKEVAEILCISPKTVDAHLVAAMKKLSEALAVNLSRL